MSVDLSWCWLLLEFGHCTVDLSRFKYGVVCGLGLLFRVFLFLLRFFSASDSGYTCCKFSLRTCNKYILSTTQVSLETCVVLQQVKTCCLVQPEGLYCNSAFRLDPVVKTRSQTLFLRQEASLKAEIWSNATHALQCKIDQIGRFCTEVRVLRLTTLEKSNGPASVPQTVSGNSRLQFAAQMRAHWILQYWSNATHSNATRNCVLRLSVLRLRAYPDLRQSLRSG